MAQGFTFTILIFGVLGFFSLFFTISPVWAIGSKKFLGLRIGWGRLLGFVWRPSPFTLTPESCRFSVYPIDGGLVSGPTKSLFHGVLDVLRLSQLTYNIVLYGEPLKELLDTKGAKT